MPYRPKPPSKTPRRSADAYLSPAKKTGVARGTYKSGGLYSTGRAIPPAPGTKSKRKGGRGDGPTYSPSKRPTRGPGRSASPRPSDKGGKAGYVRPSGSGVARGTYKPGGLYSTGRAIPPSPGTRKKYRGRGRGA